MSEQLKKLRHRKGYYKGCYTDIDSKSWVLGEVLTLKEVLDEWWNSVRIHDNNKLFCCYKNAYTCDPAYEDFDGNEVPKSKLNKYVKLDDYWEEDADGYPIVYGRWATEEEIEKGWR